MPTIIHSSGELRACGRHAGRSIRTELSTLGLAKTWHKLVPPVSWRPREVGWLWYHVPQRLRQCRVPAIRRVRPRADLGLIPFVSKNGLSFPRQCLKIYDKCVTHCQTMGPAKAIQPALSLLERRT